MQATKNMDTDRKEGELTPQRNQGQNTQQLQHEE